MVKTISNVDKNCKTDISLGSAKGCGKHEESHDEYVKKKLNI